MENKKEIIYLAQTEFHLMISVNLSLSLYNENEFINTIYYIKSDKRLNENLDTSININGTIIPIDHKDVVSNFKEIALKKVSRFYFFQENSIYNKYLAYHLREKGAIIALGPDGTKPYGVFSKKHELLSMLKDTFQDYKKLKKANLSLPKLIPSRYYKYGSSSIIDEVWLNNIEMFNFKANNTKAKLMQIPSFNEFVWNSLKQLFQYSTDLLPQKDKLLFYINQPLWSKKLVDTEIEFLNQTSSRFSDNSIVIKMHPNTAQSTIDRYLQIPNVVIVTSKVPAELFIASINNGIVFSGWSAALATNNENCNFYYILNIFRKVGDNVLEQIHIDTFKHITLIDTVDNLSFNN